MKKGMKLKALLLGFSICAASGAVGTTALLAKEAPANVTSAYADETEAGTTAEAVASVAGTNYATLQEAINAAETGATVKLLANTNANVTVAKAQNLTLDLNGFTLNGGTVSGTPAIKNEGTLTIIDSSEAKNGTIKREDTITSSEWHYVIDNQGEMIIKQAIVANDSGSSNYSKGSSLIRNGGTKTASLTIENGTFTQDRFIVIKNDDYGELYINGGTFNSKSFAVENWNNATLKGGVLNGGLFVGAWDAQKAMGNTTFTGNTVLSGTIRMCSYGNTKLTPKLSVEGGTLNVKKLTIDKLDYCDISISGGTFTSYFEPKYLATGYGFVATTNADGTTTYGVKDGFAAQIANTTNKTFGKACETLQEAIEAAEAGDTVYLLNDVSDFTGIEITKSLTVNFSKYTVTGATDATVFKVSGAKVTFTATADGGINGGSGGDNIAIQAANGSDVTISGGTYTVGGDANGLGNSTVYVTETGKVKITSGTFSSEKAYKGKYYVLNLNNSSTGSITVSGGTFINYDPSKGDDYLGGNFLAANCGMTRGNDENGNVTYRVASGVCAQVFDKDGEYLAAYTNLATAIQEAPEGSTIRLLKRVTLFGGATITKDLTIDFGDYTVSGKKDAICFTVSNASVIFTTTGKGGINGGSGGNNVAICAADGANVTISGGNYTVGGDANGEGNSTIYVVGTGKVNITDGTFSSAKPYNGKYYVLNLQNSSTGSITVSGGTFINYTPAAGDDNLGGNFVAEGYVAYESAENTYTVAETVIKQSQATLGSDITMKFFLSSADYTVKVTLNKNGSEETTKLESSGTTENGLYIYSFTGLTPQMLNRSFTVNVYDGDVLRDSYTYSVLEYCNYLLAQEETAAETKTLIAELLNYGKAAQEYLGTDSAELKEAIENAGLTTGSTIDSEAAITNSGDEIIVSGATLNFSHDNKLVFVIAKDMYANLGKYTITVNDKKIAANEWIASGDYYMWYSEGILATAFDTNYTMLVTDAEGNKLQEITISVNAYCATANKLENASEKLKNLVIATYNYGKAAKAYAAK